MNINYDRIGLVNITDGIVHLDFSFNPDASCCSADTTGETIQKEEYAAYGWKEPASSKSLADDFWGVWCDWNGKVCGGITLYDDNTQRDTDNLVSAYGTWVTPDQIANLHDGKYVVYENATICNAMNTKPADDIDMLINLCRQAADRGLEDDPTVQMPDPTRHCKHWEEINIFDLCSILESKYANAERLEIPNDHKTNY